MLKIQHVEIDRKKQHVEFKKNSMLNSGIQHVESSKSSMMKAAQAKQQVQMRLLRAETSV